MKKFKKAILPVALSLSVVGLAGCSGGTTYVSSKAGKVNEKEIIENLGSKAVSKTAIEIMANKILLDKYKDKIDAKYIDKEYKKFETQQGGKESFEKTLTTQGFTTDKFKEALKVRYARALMIADYANIDDNKIKEAYEKEKVQYHLAHILISIKTDANPNGLADDAAKTKAEEILKQVKDGGDFATLAKENSTDTGSKEKGGDLDWSTPSDNKFVEDFAKTAYALKKGEVSNVVKTPFGYHIIKLLDTKDLALDDIKADLIEKLAQEAVNKDQTLTSKALKKLFEEYNVKGDTNEAKSSLDEMFKNLG